LNSKAPQIESLGQSLAYLKKEGGALIKMVKMSLLLLLFCAPTARAQSKDQLHELRFEVLKDASLNQSSDRGVTGETLFENGSSENETELGRRSALAQRALRMAIDQQLKEWFSSTPELEQIQRLEKKISEVEVQLSTEISVQTQFSLIENKTMVEVKNPWCEMRAEIDNRGSSVFILGLELSPEIHLEFREDSEKTHLNVRKKLASDSELIFAIETKTGGPSTRSPANLTMNLNKSY
jgi:hypothetical protein